jgi:hypothetical protein
LALAFPFAYGARHAAAGGITMDGMWNMMGGMGGAMGLVSLLVISLLILGIVALAKYMFFK